MRYRGKEKNIKVKSKEESINGKDLRETAK